MCQRGLTTPSGTSPFPPSVSPQPLHISERPASPDLREAPVKQPAPSDKGQDLCHSGWGFTSLLRECNICAGTPLSLRADGFTGAMNMCKFHVCTQQDMTCRPPTPGDAEPSTHAWLVNLFGWVLGLSCTVFYIFNYGFWLWKTSKWQGTYFLTKSLQLPPTWGKQPIRLKEKKHYVLVGVFHEVSITGMWFPLFLPLKKRIHCARNKTQAFIDQSKFLFYSYVKGLWAVYSLFSVGPLHQQGLHVWDLTNN